MDWRIQVAVVDASGRPREIEIGVRGKQVVCNVPPGEGFTMDAQNAYMAASGFEDAADRAAGRRR